MHKQQNKFRILLRKLYFGDGKLSLFWRWGLFTFDIITIGYFLITATLDLSHTALDLHQIDYIIGFVLLTDYFFRIYISARPVKSCFEATALADLLVILSLFAAAFIENLGFLRVVRMLRLLRSYHVLKDLRNASKWFAKNEEIIHSALNLFVFIFVISAIVYVLEAHLNPAINSFMDALYFTVTTLTTTGYGDITMSDTLGRGITIIIMIFGVALFLRLVQTIFRPAKVRYPCPTCGLNRHDPDAVHCKHCGNTLKIPSEGDWQ
ncbi:potassium channel family protein [Polycladidibacter stylochi]|uniref:potassium channel family protein n=1 Tax=Polycladidibacter stylochi TaxID=1807766 RepID=UPI00082F2609|nr:potassium channel family protein [Pseudovibrio stylochi]